MKNVHKQLYICVSLYFIIVLSMVALETMNSYGCYDTDFLINRARNMLDCIMDFKYPFFYYNDFGGAGYGSSFFYGQLTLLPFLPFLFLGDKVFLYVYMIVTLILTQQGVRFFAKRFTDNYDFIALLYLGSTWLLYYLCETTLFPNTFGVSIGFFFLGYCIDFFRDRKSFIPASIVFVVLLNTHLITSVVCFIGCIYFLVMYFDFKRFKGYIKFALITCLLCAYNIVNILIHMTTTKELSEVAFISSAGFAMDNMPIRGVLYNTFINGYRTGLVYMNIALFIFLVIGIVQYRYSKREIISLALIVVSMIIGCQTIWRYLLHHFTVFIQFPYRYVPYVLICLMILVFRKYKNKFLVYILIGLSIFEITFGGYYALCFNHDDADIGDPKDHFNEIGLGEYLDDSFDRTFEMYDFMKEHRVYDFDSKMGYLSWIDKDRMYIDLRGNISSEVTIFKLWYKGYKAYTVSSDENYDIINEVPISMGGSQFIEINTEYIDDIVMIRYKCPFYLVILLICDYGLFFYLLWFYRQKHQSVI